MKKCLILANGFAPKKNEVSFLRKQNYLTLICADGGANSARKLNLIPDFIIGDLDSITQSNLDFYKAKSKIIKITRQSDTDVEKAIKFAIENSFDEAILLGVIGNRLDHSFGNLSIAVRFSDQINLRIISGKSVLSIVKGERKFNSVKGETISIYAFDEKTLITSEGLKYNIETEPLNFGKKESTSNVSLGSEFSLKVENGTAFLVRDFDTVKKNDLF